MMMNCCVCLAEQKKTGKKAKKKQKKNTRQRKRKLEKVEISKILQTSHHMQDALKFLDLHTD